MHENLQNKIIMSAIFILFLAAALVIWKIPIKLGLDLHGGLRVVVEALDTPEIKVNADIMDGVRQVIRNRIDGFGIAEPVIQRKGERQVVIEIPGMQDVERTLAVIGSTALLEFKEAEWVPGDLSLLTEKERQDYLGADSSLDTVKHYNAKGELINESQIILRKTVLTGADLKTVVPGTDEYGRPVVSLEFTSEGARKFYTATLRSVGRPLAILLDGRIISAPNVNEAISGGRAQISGTFTVQEMHDLVVQLKAGSLPVPIEVIENRVVGPTLGRDAVDKSLKAAGIAFALVAVVMLLLYRFNGLLADVALIIYAALVLAALILMQATLTLPGIAGLILSVGMAVDANIIIFARLKEELGGGLPGPQAVDNAFNKSITAILDGNITTLIAAAFLFFLGSGSIKGFAVTLSVGILLSMFSALIVTRQLMKNVYQLKAAPAKENA
ncbi:MAG: protein translocase subunit SecD [Candidatus Margulisbacteria bacterium]|jgi:preprotein translocase subunit SecD|nr:protein translocase subunit SecD [Candidatus Margulisiibacteriota bacterium]